MAPTDDPLEPTALDGSPGQAFASHKARANGIARFYALKHPLETLNGKPGEGETFWLIAHLHAASDDPDFKVGQEASRTLAPKVLRRLNRGDGQVGTKRDYDMALKGLITIAYRYGDLLAADGVNFILDELVPPDISGGHPAAIEIYQVSFLNIDVPETENHLLMIESSRYLINQLLHDRTGDSKYDNSANGLSSWLLGYMQTIAKHDFLEFNSRPYARLALHPLHNLHEFARDEPIRTAAQILLDYTMVKFAVSSNRGRRVSPYRRQQYRINHQANERNDLYAESGDQVAGYFMAYTGFIDHEGKPGKLPESLTDTALISGTAAYRPPPAAYILAMSPNNPASLHRFYHGTRPRLRGSPDIADGGLEIYYSSPSFLLSAGGMFLNSGYGHDEITLPGKLAWEQTSRAQATTLIPTRADTNFADLIRFEPYPDPLVDPYAHVDPHAHDPADPDTLQTGSVNIGVHRGLAAGANLRPAETKTVFEQSTSSSPALAFHADRLLTAWKGSGNDNLNVAKVQATSTLGIDGVEGVEEKVTLANSTDTSPALASHDGRLFLAWKGSGNNQLNLTLSEDNGLTFKGAKILADSSKVSPSLASHAGRLFLAWTGEGEEKLNVAKVVLFANTAGGFGIEGLEDKVVLGDSSEAAPALASHDGRLFLAWKGSGNNQLNLTLSEDNGLTFKGAKILADSSKVSPSLASHAGRLFLAWTGEGEEKLNVAKVVLFANTAGGFGIEGLEDKVVLNETSTEAPALGSQNGLLFLAWKGEAFVVGRDPVTGPILVGADNLNLRLSRDGAFQAAGPWFFSNLEHLGFFVAAYRTPPTGDVVTDAWGYLALSPLDNLALVYAMEAGGMDFDRFMELTKARNSGLPTKLDYGGVYEFHSPDDKRFSIRFQLSEQKYTARIVDLNDPSPVSDLSTLPLVDGEYLRAPGGHDGYLEIRHPGCNTPLVLDFRNATTPIRQDNLHACPEPWLTRAQALYDVAWQLWNATRRHEALSAMRERVKVFEQLARSDPQRFQSQLAKALVDEAAFRAADLAGAQAAAMRAVKLDQELAGVPDAVEYPDLSGLVPNEQWLSLQEALYYLAWAQWDDGKHAEGLRSMRNRVRLYEQLAAQDPGKYAAGLHAAEQDEASFHE